MSDFGWIGSILAILVFCAGFWPEWTGEHLGRTYYDFEQGWHKALRTTVSDKGEK